MFTTCTFVVNLYKNVGRALASGSNDFYTEESFSYVVSPGSYKLQFWFWKWDDTLVPECPTFRMQLSISTVNRFRLFTKYASRQILAALIMLTIGLLHLQQHCRYLQLLIPILVY